MSDKSAPPPAPTAVVARPVSEALLNEKVALSLSPFLDRVPFRSFGHSNNHAQLIVGPLPLQRPRQVFPRPRLRRRLLGSPLQAEGMARVRRRRLRCGTRIRGVQLELEGGVQGSQEAGIDVCV